MARGEIQSRRAEAAASLGEVDRAAELAAEAWALNATAGVAREGARVRRLHARLAARADTPAVTALGDAIRA